MVQIKLFLVLVIVYTTMASPMFYKKNENDKYEPGEYAHFTLILFYTISERNCLLLFFFYIVLKVTKYIFSSFFFFFSNQVLHALCILILFTLVLFTLVFKYITHCAHGLSKYGRWTVLATHIKKIAQVTWKLIWNNIYFFIDLVAVSSTVIPLTVYEVSYGIGGKPSEEYKQAYMKRLHKKVKHVDENPDTLITRKSIVINYIIDFIY